jgi:Ca-activated chloride channel family protein
MTRLSILIVVGLPLIAAALIGVDPAARVLIAIGLSDQAAWLARDPMLRGEAHYASRRWTEAAAAFRDAGSLGSYNLGTALARDGRLAEAVRSYDTALVLDPRDEDAAFNRALVLALLERAAQAGAGAMPGSGVNVPPGQGGLPASDDDRPPPGDGEGRPGNDDAQAASGSAGGGKALRQKGDDASRNAVRQATGSAADAEGPGSKSAELAEVAKQIKDRWRRFGKSYEAQSVLPTREWLDAIPDDPGKFLKLRLAAEQAQRLARGGSARESVR